MERQPIRAGNIGKGKAGAVEDFLKEFVAFLRSRAQSTFLGGIRTHLAGKGVELAGRRTVEQLAVVEQTIRGRERRAMQIIGGEGCRVDGCIRSRRGGTVGDR
jgi:hypothetical protein